MDHRVSIVSSSRSPTIRQPFASYLSDTKTKWNSLGTSSSSNFESDLFSYEPDELYGWEIPESLTENLPVSLRNAIAYWQCAAAAVSSGLSRISKLYKESLHRGWPRASSTAQNPVRPSSPISIPMVASIDTPPDSPSTTTTRPSISQRCDSLITDTVANRTIPGIESPPLTPLSTRSAATPIQSHGDNTPGVGQIQRLTETRQDSTVRNEPQFDEAAWEAFIGEVKAEIQTMRDTTWPRLKACNRQLGSPEIRCGLVGAVREGFENWWRACEGRCYDHMLEIMALEEPNLELIKLERVTKGLSL